MAQDLILRVPPARESSRIRLGRGGLERLGAFVRSSAASTRAVVVSDPTVAALHGARALRALRRARVSAELVTIPRGEGAKSPRQLARLWDLFAELALERDACVVALGGGVVGDLAGCAAATWLRGVPWVSVPTTLLAQVDSGVGGKTGVNLARGKNLVGAFHQPAGILIDPEVLATLPARHVRCGLAEIVKAGMAVDAALFRWLEGAAPRLAAADSRALEQAAGRALRAKARIVARDPRERPGGVRTALNFGHTAGHAIEAALGYRRLLHGEAVAIGMRIAAALSTERAGLDPGVAARLDALLDAFSLPRRMPALPLRDLMEAMQRDKKRRGREIRWVLTPRLGHASVPRSIPSRLVEAALVEAGARP